MCNVQKNSPLYPHRRLLLCTVSETIWWRFELKLPGNYFNADPDSTSYFEVDPEPDVMLKLGQVNNWQIFWMHIIQLQLDFFSILKLSKGVCTYYVIDNKLEVLLRKNSSDFYVKRVGSGLGSGSGTADPGYWSRFQIRLMIRMRIWNMGAAHWWDQRH